VSSPLLARLVGHPIATDVAIIGPDGQSGGAGTYGAIGARARALGAEMRGKRLSLEGARVAFLLPAGRAYVDVLLATFLAGGTAVPLSPLHAQAELAHAITDSAPEILVATSETAARLEPLREGRRLIIVEQPRTIGAATDAIVNESSPALILYTSGTTGKPKGVVLSHGAIAATLASLEEAWKWQRRDRLLHVLPLHHTHGVIVALLGALWAGATAQIVPFEAERVWDLFAESSIFMGVPTMYSKLMDAYAGAEEARRARWSQGAKKLRLATSGSAALSAKLHGDFERATGVRILERYGMTEIGMALSNPYEGERVAGSVGFELPGVQIDLVDDELRVRSPQMFSGYHGDRAATEASFDEEGRFKTGDVGVRDERGYIRLLGRASSDILKSGGYKLSALEIEEVLREHPAIAEVAVIGVPDDTWGDRVTACCVLRSPLTIEELRAWGKERLAVYKVPQELRVLDALPRNAMGKVQKKALKG
jgi:malonyl-CoA/methylmalonyl-CoA synthetase